MEGADRHREGVERAGEDGRSELEQGEAGQEPPDELAVALREAAAVDPDP